MPPVHHLAITTTCAPHMCLGPHNPARPGNVPMPGITLITMGSPMSASVNPFPIIYMVHMYQRKLSSEVIKLRMGSVQLYFPQIEMQCGSGVSI